MVLCCRLLTFAAAPGIRYRDQSARLPTKQTTPDRLAIDFAKCAEAAGIIKAFVCVCLRDSRVKVM